MRGTLIALIVGAAVIAGCGGGDDNEESAAKPAATATATQAPADDSGGGGAAETVKFSAPSDGSLKFDQGDVTAKAGKVTIEFSNPSSTPHAVDIEGNGVDEDTETVTGGDAPPVTVDLKPGKYEYFCPVPGHREAGMEGTLTVQ
jgi:plastocyanin